jgi:hypothetical protein
MKCEHAGCRCGEAALERGGKRYCSDHCAQERTDGTAGRKGCGCGHPGCA